MGTIADWVHMGQMDELGRQDTPVHRLDPRAKLVVTAAYLVVVMSFDRYALSALTPLLLYPVALMAAGRIPPHVIVRKVLLASPFALVVGLFNPLLDPTPLVALGPWEVSGGWVSLGSILVRFGLTVSAALVLVAVTGLFRLGAGLERLGVPRLFVQQLFFLYRYLFVLADEVTTMFRAAQVRAAGLRALPLKVFGTLVGLGLLRALDRAGRIHCAMVARGYDGEIRASTPSSSPGWRDGFFVAGWLLFFGVTRCWNLAEALGRFIL